MHIAVEHNRMKIASPTHHRNNNRNLQYQDQDAAESESSTCPVEMLSRRDSATQHTMAIMRKSLSFEPLINRESTFWPSAQDLMAKHPSFEFLNPEHDSELRKSSPVSAIFNLVATVCGGGVLTLPIAFARVGIIPSTIMMVFSAVITDFSMYILCSCARRTGGKSYGDVTRIAFGRKAEVAVMILLFVFLFFVIVAYMVLVKDIWTPLLLYVSPFFRSLCVNYLGVDPDHSNVPSEAFLLFFIILSLPLVLKKDLHALRHTCYVGFVSLILLIVAIVQRSYQLNCILDVGTFGRSVKWYSTDINDIIYAFPIISLSFFSIYNVLTVHSALVNPTRERVKFVLDGTIILCLVLFYIVGLSGYLYAYEDTKDNILLNFPLSFTNVLIGRLGYGFTLMFGLPLVFLPCREALLSIPGLVMDAINEGDETGVKADIQLQESAAASKTARMSGLTKDGHVVINGIDFDEEKPLLKRNSSIIPMKKAVETGSIIPMQRLVSGGFHYGSTNPQEALDGGMKNNAATGRTQSQENVHNDIETLHKDNNGHIRGEKENLKEFDEVHDRSNTVVLIKTKSSETEDAQRSFQEKAAVSNTIHVLSTLFILAFGYICSIAVPGVGLVWSICGSSMSMMIGFFIPAACYLKIRSRKRLNPRSISAWLMLIFAILASVICTTQVIADAKKDLA